MSSVVIPWPTSAHRPATGASSPPAGLPEEWISPCTVAPFILRGITLVGIDSVMCPRPERLAAWQRLGTDLDVSKLAAISHEVGLTELLPLASELIDGKLRGRVVVDVNR